MEPPASRLPARIRFLAGALLAGYGSLVLLRLLAHESPLMGALILLAGGALLWSARTPSTAAPAAPAPEATRGRALAAALLGLLSAGGVVGYNAIRGSTLELPEVAILVYGLLLLAAAPNLERRIGPVPVAPAVAWSVPLVAAPLALYALDAMLDAGVGSSPLDAFITHALVAPMSAFLTFVGFEVTNMGQTLLLTTPRGKLALTVGVVCAGLEPGVLFLGVLGLHAFREGTPPARFAALLGLGLAGIYLANLLRLVALTVVGYHWGGNALQQAHAHAGWLVFVAVMLGFWAIALRPLEGPKRHS